MAVAQDSLAIPGYPVAEKSHGTSVQGSSSRKWIAGGVSVGAFGGSFVLLNEAWYKGYPRTSFHTFNDGGEWMQMDKIGHAWTAYTISHAASRMWRWAGMDKKAAALTGSGTSLAYLLSIEYLDGRSAEWGWSWPDVVADLSGTGLFAAQELAWGEQKIALKFSVHPHTYRPESLNDRANSLFGNSLMERLLKDYNTQTYWLSVPVKDLFPQKKIPGWISISVGQGADGLFGGYENIAYDKNGTVTFDRRDIPRYRQWYFAPDIDWTRIPTRKKGLKLLFTLLNTFKFPAPALELRQNRFRVRALVF